MDSGLKGKVALVTGGSKGIGFAIAQALAAEGCHLRLAARLSTASTASTAPVLQWVSANRRERQSVHRRTGVLR